MMTEERHYTGIGSRKTPDHILKFMTNIARYYQRLGFVLRSGGADGADTAFEDGVTPVHDGTRLVAPKQIFIPWRGFNGHYDGYLPTDKSFEIAAKYHPNWNKLKPGPRKLHARNVHQVLGKDLESPTECVICWTPDGRFTGGTGQALRIAADYDVPIYNLYFKEVREMFIYG